jgi:hypothetical protein
MNSCRITWALEFTGRKVADMAVSPGCRIVAQFDIPFLGVIMHANPFHGVAEGLNVQITAETKPVTITKITER